MVRDGFEPGNMPPIIYDIPKSQKHINKTKIILIICLILLILVAYFIFKKPTVILKGDKVEKVSYKTEFVDTGIIARYHGKDITNKVKSINNVNTKQLGEYKVTYKMPYWFGTYEYTRKVIVVDELAPEIKLNGDEECKISYKEEFKEPGYKATDNYDGDLTKKVEVTVEDTGDAEKSICYKVLDSSGNKREIKRKIIMIDDVKPNIEIVGDGTIVLDVGQQYQEQGAKTQDEKDGDLTDKIQISGDVNTNQQGTYLVSYTVSDNSQNTAIATREVIVNNIGKAAMNVGTPSTVYLTFDDGPTTSITPKILDILKEKGVKATFFIIDYGKDKEDLVKRIVEEGHSIGIHGGTHEYKDVYSSANAYLNGLDYMKEKIKNTTGLETNIIRFPGGSSNTVSRKYCEGVMTILTNETVKRGYRYFDWNVMSGDSGDVHDATGVYNNVIMGLKPTRANVVLMHDFSGNNKTLEALPNIIDYGMSNGYIFEKVTDKTPMVTQNVQN